MVARTGLKPVSDSKKAFNELVEGWGLDLGFMVYLQIDRSVSADGFLMGMHIGEAGSPKRTGLSHLVG